MGPGRNLLFPEAVHPEVWIEVYVRFSATYKTDWRPEGGAASGGTPTTSSFSLDGLDRAWIVAGSTNTASLDVVITSVPRHRTPGNHTRERVRHGLLPNSCFNEQWQRMRFRLRSADPGVWNGEFEWWRVSLTDGNEILVDTCDSLEPYHLLLQGIAEVNDGFDNLSFGVTFNVGPAPGVIPDAEWIWRLIRVWREDPGWELR